MEATRRAIEALRTDTPPLPETLPSFAESHVEQYQTLTDLRITGTRELQPVTNLTLIQVTREALLNSTNRAAAIEYATHHLGPEAP